MNSQNQHILVNKCGKFISQVLELIIQSRQDLGLELNQTFFKNVDSSSEFQYEVLNQNNFQEYVKGQLDKSLQEHKNQYLNGMYLQQSIDKTQEGKIIMLVRLTENVLKDNFSQTQVVEKWTINYDIEQILQTEQKIYSQQAQSVHQSVNNLMSNSFSLSQSQMQMTMFDQLSIQKMIEKEQQNVDKVFFIMIRSLNSILHSVLPVKQHVHRFRNTNVKTFKCDYKLELSNFKQQSQQQFSFNDPYYQKNKNFIKKYIFGGSQSQQNFSSGGMLMDNFQLVNIEVEYLANGKVIDKVFQDQDFNIVVNSNQLSQLSPQNESKILIQDYITNNNKDAQDQQLASVVSSELDILQSSAAVGRDFDPKNPKKTIDDLNLQKQESFEIIQDDHSNEQNLSSGKKNPQVSVTNENNEDQEEEEEDEDNILAIRNKRLQQKKKGVPSAFEQMVTGLAGDPNQFGGLKGFNQSTTNNSSNPLKNLQQQQMNPDKSVHVQSRQHRLLTQDPQQLYRQTLVYDNYFSAENSSNQSHISSSQQKVQESQTMTNDQQQQNNQKEEKKEQIQKSATISASLGDNSNKGPILRRSRFISQDSHTIFQNNFLLSVQKPSVDSADNSSTQLQTQKALNPFKNIRSVKKGNATNSSTYSGQGHTQPQVSAFRGNVTKRNSMNFIPNKTKSTSSLEHLLGQHHNYQTGDNLPQNTCTSTIHQQDTSEIRVSDSEQNKTGQKEKTQGVNSGSNFVFKRLASDGQTYEIIQQSSFNTNLIDTTKSSSLQSLEEFVNNYQHKVIKNSNQSQLQQKNSFFSGIQGGESSPLEEVISEYTSSDDSSSRGQSNQDESQDHGDAIKKSQVVDDDNMIVMSDSYQNSYLGEDQKIQNFQQFLYKIKQKHKKKITEKIDNTEQNSNLSTSTSQHMQDQDMRQNIYQLMSLKQVFTKYYQAPQSKQE